MQSVWQWRHCFKLDPEKKLADEHLQQLLTSGTDGLLVGGTLGVTYENTSELLHRIRALSKLPCILEVSNLEAIVPGFDHYLIPMVLNALDSEWLLQPHVQAVKHFAEHIPWEFLSMVGYCVLNPHSGVAQLTKSDSDLTLDDVLAYGRVAAHVLSFPHFYLEYSGTLGDLTMVKEVYHRLKQETGIHIFYGGGIRDTETAQQAAQVCDTIVVGNIIYEELEAALATVQQLSSSQG